MGRPLDMDSSRPNSIRRSSTISAMRHRILPRSASGIVAQGPCLKARSALATASATSDSPALAIRATVSPLAGFSTSK